MTTIRRLSIVVVALGLVLIGVACGEAETPLPLPSPLPPATQAPRIYMEDQELVVVTDGAALRSGPSEDYEQVATVNAGEQLASTGHTNDWYLLDVEIDSPTGEVWIAAADAELFVPTATPTEEPTEEATPEATPSPAQPAGDQGQSGGTQMPPMMTMLPPGLPGDIPGGLPIP
jgi:hypothetical protein